MVRGLGFLIVLVFADALLKMACSFSRWGFGRFTMRGGRRSLRMGVTNVLNTSLSMKP